MSTISQPVVNVSLTSEPAAVGTLPKKVLFVAQKTAVGTATSGSLVSNIQNDGSESALFGANSQLAEMIRAYKRYNQVTQIDAIPLDDDGAAVAAFGDIIFSGTATENNTLTVVVGSARNYSFQLDVDNGDTADTIGQNLANLINANSNAPVTAVNVTGTVTLTAVNAGTVGNSIGLRVTGTVAGVAILNTGMGGGATDPSTTNVFDVVGEVRYQFVATPSEYGTNLLTSFLDPRFNVNNAILDGVGYQCFTDTFANGLTYVAGLNSRNLGLIQNKLVNESLYKGGNILELNYNIVAQFTAIRALRLTQNTNISDFVIVPDGLDQFGGDGIAALPYANTPFRDLPLVDQDQEFTFNEMEQLEQAGVTLLGNNASRNQIIAGNVVTTYVTDNAGNPDDSFHFLNLVDESVTAREIFFNRSKQQFAQKRLTEGDIVPGRSYTNVNEIRAFFIQTYIDLSGPDFAITVAGDDALNFYKDNLFVTITNFVDGIVTVTMKLPIVTQVRQINEAITIVFSLND